jgi:hypothetical protein
MSRISRRRALMASFNEERCSADKKIDACGRVLLQHRKNLGSPDLSSDRT